MAMHTVEQVSVLCRIPVDHPPVDWPTMENAQPTTCVPTTGNTVPSTNRTDGEDCSHSRETRTDRSSAPGASSLIDRWVEPRIEVTKVGLVDPNTNESIRTVPR